MGLSWDPREATTKDADSLKLCVELAYTEYQGRIAGTRLPAVDADCLSEINNYLKKEI